MSFYRIRGISATPFTALFGLDVDALGARGVQRYIVDEMPGFPDRIELRDLELGETALLLNYVHQDAQTPYRASHAIFVREGATQTYDRINEVPDVLRIRQLSLRAFDATNMMVDADLTDGQNVENLIERMFAKPEISYIQAHYAKRGCFAARIDRI